MGVIAWIIIGLIAGWLANAILGGRGGGLLYNLAVGLVGAIVGGLIIFGPAYRAGIRFHRRNWSAPPSAPSCFC